jgi:pectate lyase
MVAGVLIAAGGSPHHVEGRRAATPTARVVAVTSTQNDGPGTLREALMGSGPRRVVFRVAGTIALVRRLEIREGRGITVDGASAPPPGITLVKHGIAVLDSEDVSIRHLRVRGARTDGIAISNSRRVVVEHCSVSDSGDENISVTEHAQDVTIAWCLIAESQVDSERHSKGMLVANFKKPAVSNLSVHHTLFVNQSQRSPQVSSAGLFDLRNNVVVNWRAYGMRFRQGAFGNVVNNFFSGERNAGRAVVVNPDAGPVHVRGNVAPPAAGDVNRASTAAEAWPVAPVTTETAQAAAHAVVASAGAVPRDGLDARLAKQAAASIAGRRGGS